MWDGNLLVVASMPCQLAAVAAVAVLQSMKGYFPLSWACTDTPSSCCCCCGGGGLVWCQPTMTHQVTQTANGVRAVEKGSSPAAALLVQVGN